MAKSAEQGDIWEWRAFGAPGREIVDAIQSHPIRMGIRETEEEDLYFVSPTSDQNIKLRRARDGWLLKVKLLLKTREGAELYRETQSMIHKFPIESSIAYEVIELLETKVPGASATAGSLDRDQLVRLIAHSSPPVDLTPVLKTRSQFDFGNGWVEIAEAAFPMRTVQSISIQSFELKEVDRIRQEIIGARLESIEVMNYVMACRKWTHPL